MNDGSLTDRQARVFEALDARSPGLAGVYRMALAQLSVETEPTLAVARLAIVAHCMRELMLGLTTVLTDLSIPRPRPSSVSLASRLPAALARSPEIDLTRDQDLIPITRSFALSISDLIATVGREQNRNQLNFAALVTNGTDPRHPAIAQYNGAYDFFLKWAHLDRHPQGRELPTDDVIMTEIERVEDVILNRTAEFFDALHAVEEVLTRANAKAEGEKA